MVHSKPFIKLLIGILLLTVRFVRSLDQTIIQIIRKNKSTLMFSINPNNCFTKTYLKPSQHLRWMSLCIISLWPSAATVRKNSILRVAGVLNLSLKLYILCSKICARFNLKINDWKYLKASTLCHIQLKYSTFVCIMPHFPHVHHLVMLLTFSWFFTGIRDILFFFKTGFIYI